MNRLKNGTIAVGAPGSEARKKAEQEDAAKESLTISVTFSTLSGRKNVLWTLGEALTSELEKEVRHLLSLREEGAVGIQIDHPFFGKVNLDVVGGNV